MEENLYEGYENDDNEFTESEKLKIIKQDAKFDKQENGDDQKRPPIHITPLLMYDNSEYVHWICSAEGKVWIKLYRHIVRGRMLSLVNKKLYREYYVKGLLVSYRSEQDIAEFLGYKDRAYINKLIKSMVDKGIIKIHKDKWGSRSRNIYELGFHADAPHYHETLHSEVIFTKMAANKKLKKLLN